MRIPRELVAALVYVLRMAAQEERAHGNKPWAADRDGGCHCHACLHVNEVKRATGHMDL